MLFCENSHKGHGPATKEKRKVLECSKQNASNKAVVTYRLSKIAGSVLRHISKEACKIEKMVS